MERVQEGGTVTMLLLMGGVDIWEENIQELLDFFGGDSGERRAGIIPPYTLV